MNSLLATKLHNKKHDCFKSGPRYFKLLPQIHLYFLLRLFVCNNTTSRNRESCYSLQRKVKVFWDSDVGMSQIAINNKLVVLFG